MYGGTTLLGRMLGELKGFFFVGELAHIWDAGFVRNKRCGCGVSFRSCPTWSAIIDEAFGGPDAVDFERLAGITSRLVLNRRLPHALLADAGHGPSAAQLDELRTALIRLYGAVRTVTGCTVIVDTSKSPTYAMALDGADGIELRVVQLVRDPRGSLMSRLRRGAGFRPSIFIFLWAASHALSELLWRRGRRYLRVRYEDLVDQSGRTFTEVARFAGVLSEGVAAERGIVTLGPSHAVDGNRNRFETGAFELALDDAWRSELPTRLRLLSNALTWPMLLRHGYGLTRR